MKKRDIEALLSTLQRRFEAHRYRHQDVAWNDVLKRVDGNKDALTSLLAMETSGGEPDVVVLPGSTSGITFYDCSPESPIGRRSLCYDEQALNARKANKPAGSAVGMADSMGITLMSPSQYEALQQFTPLDQKTSSWLLTPEAIRSLGGAIFGDRRYATTFIYHNGAESYYAARGFRGWLAV